MKQKKRRFGHSIKELWVINRCACPFLSRVGCHKVYICTNRLNHNRKRHSICKYASCPIAQMVAYEDYDQEEENEYS